jgi:hypothetical protein
MTAGSHTGAHRRTVPRPRMGRSSFGLQKKAITANENPGTWKKWKAQHPWPRLFSFEWVLKWVRCWGHGSATFWFLEVAGWIATVASVFVAAYWWVSEADDRRIARQNAVKENHYRAWELINSARDLTGDGGRRDALQDLNEDKVDLSAAPLANAYLVSVKLPNANLTGADLRGAVLSMADLTEANLAGANLAGANLDGTNLTKANLARTTLHEVDLSETDLAGANLSGAALVKAYLFKANLSGNSLFGLI